jgi:ABC-2 type transport system permease protein
MARIMKYEFIKNRFRYLIMAAILLLVEVGFLITNAASYHILSGMLLLLMVAEVGTLLIVIFEGIAMFNRDLREKTGYMVFMTPLPSWQILLGKIAVILLVGSALFIGYTFLGYLDLHLLVGAMKREDPSSAMIPMLSALLDQLYGPDSMITLVKLLLCIICFVAYFVCLAYLSSTISASVLRGKKGGKVISLVLFIAMIILAGYINSKFTGFGHAGVTLGANGLELKISEVWISLIFELGCSAAALAFSSYLLENKVDI